MAKYTLRMPASKTINPVGHCTLVLRVQAEYSIAAETVTLRCRLETPATGQHRGFSDLPALLAAIEADLLAMQQRLLVTDQEQQS
jgi:hypothetical protein